ncbi:MAG: hypothetical protein U0R24_07035 [Solirubrobacterales bacterium]
MATAEAQPGKSRPSHPELPVCRPTGDPPRSAASGPSACACGWLMFAAIGILTGTTVYLFVSGSASAAERTADLAAGRTNRLQDRVELALPGAPLTRANIGPAVDVLRQSRPSDRFRTWIYNTPTMRDGKRVGARVVSPRSVQGSTSPTFPGRARRSRRSCPTAAPTSTPTSRTAGRSSPSSSSAPSASRARCCRCRSSPRRSPRRWQPCAGSGARRFRRLGDRRPDRLLVASLIDQGQAPRRRRGQLAEGHLDKPLDSRRPGRSATSTARLDAYSLAETFDALSSERDHLGRVRIAR